MPVYSFTAADMDWSLVRGTTIADTPRQARDELRQRGLSVLDLAQQATAKRSRWARLSRSGGAGAGLTELVRDLSTLLGVGLPMLEALDTLGRQRRGRARTDLMLLRDRVAAGASLAEAMRESSHVFDDVTVHMTEVGENAGTLDKVLDELAAFKDRMTQLKGKIGSALIYPAIVLATGVGVSLFLMGYVVPNLLESLAESGRELPLVTKIVKGASDLLVHRGWLLLGAVLLMGFVAGAIRQTRRGKRLLHRALLRIPLLGELVRKQAVARIAFVTSTLMRSGVPFEQAISIARRSTNNVVLKDALETCERAVIAGRDIGAALEHTRAFSPTVVQVFALGQQSGRMEEMLDRLATDYDRQVAAAAARFTAALEPVLILLLAAVVGTIAFATVLPILELGHVI